MQVAKAERMLGCVGSECHAHMRGISCIAKGQRRWRIKMKLESLNYMFRLGISCSGFVTLFSII